MHKIEKQILLEIKKELNENTPPTEPTKQQALDWANSQDGTDGLELMKNYLNTLKQQGQNKKAFLKKLFDKPLLQNKGIVTKLFALFKKSDDTEDEPNELDFIEDKEKEKIFKFIYFTLKAEQSQFNHETIIYPLTLFGLVKPGEQFVPKEFKQMTPQLIQKIVKAKPLPGALNTIFFKKGMNLVDDFISEVFDKDDRGTSSGPTLDQTFYDEQIKNFQAAYSPIIASYRITIGNVIKDLAKKIAAKPENEAQLEQVKGELEAYKNFIEDSVAPLINADNKSFVSALETLIKSNALKDAPIKNIFQDEAVKEKFIKSTETLEEGVEIFQPETKDFIDLTNVSSQTPLDRRKSIVDRLATAIRVQLKQIGRKVDEYTGKTPKSITTQDFLQDLNDKGIDVSEEDLNKVKEIATRNKDKIEKYPSGFMGFLNSLWSAPKKAYEWIKEKISDDTDKIELVYRAQKANKEFMNSFQNLKTEIESSDSIGQEINDTNEKKIIYKISTETEFGTKSKMFKLDDDSDFGNKSGSSVVINAKPKNKFGVYPLSKISKDIADKCKGEDSYKHLTNKDNSDLEKLKELVNAQPGDTIDDKIDQYAQNFNDPKTNYMKGLKQLLAPAESDGGDDQLSFQAAVLGALEILLKQRETTATPTPNVNAELLRAAIQAFTGVAPGNEETMARVVTSGETGEAEINSDELVDVFETGSEGIEEIEARTNEIVNNQEERGRIEQEIQQDIPEASQQEVSDAVNAAIEAIKKATSEEEGADDADISGFEELINKMIRNLGEKGDDEQHDFSDLLKNYIRGNLTESTQPTQQDIVAAIGENGFDSFVKRFSKPMTVGEARELLSKLKDLVGRVKEKRDRPDNKTKYKDKELKFIFTKRIEANDQLSSLKIDRDPDLNYNIKRGDKVKVVEVPHSSQIYDAYYYFKFDDKEGKTKYGKLTEKEFFINLVPNAWRIFKALRKGTQFKLKNDSGITEEKLKELASSTGKLKGIGNHVFDSDSQAIPGKTYVFEREKDIQKFNNFTWTTSGQNSYIELKGPTKNLRSNQTNKNGTIYVRSSKDLRKYFKVTKWVKDQSDDSLALTVNLGDDPPKETEGLKVGDFGFTEGPQNNRFGYNLEKIVLIKDNKVKTKYYQLVNLIYDKDDLKNRSEIEFYSLGDLSPGSRHLDWFEPENENWIPIDKSKLIEITAAEVEERQAKDSSASNRDDKLEEKLEKTINNYINKRKQQWQKRTM